MASIIHGFNVAPLFIKFLIINQKIIFKAINN